MLSICELHIPEPSPKCGDSKLAAYQAKRDHWRPLSWGTQQQFAAPAGRGVGPYFCGLLSHAFCRIACCRRLASSAHWQHYPSSCSTIPMVLLLARRRAKKLASWLHLQQPAPEPSCK